MRPGRVMYVQYTNPGGYPPLQHSSRILADSGWEVLFLGIGAVGAGGLRFPPHERIRVRALSFTTQGWRQWLWYACFCLWVLGWALRWRPTLVYASDYLACPIALLLSFLPGLQVVYHEHDSPAPAAGDPGREICLGARRALAQRAAVCVLPNETRVTRFVAQVGGAPNVVCAWNCPARADVAPPRVADDAETLWVYFHGSIVPSHLPPTVLDALARVPGNVKLRVIGYETVGHPGYVRRLEATAHRLGLDGRVEFVGPMSRHDLMLWAQRSDVGLSFLPKVPRAADDPAMVGASNKAFDYLACGMPLLVSDLDDWREAFVAPGYALAADPDDPASIAAALRWYLEHPEQRRDMGEQGRQRIAEDWNYESQFARVCEHLSRPGPQESSRTAADAVRA